MRATWIKRILFVLAAGLVFLPGRYIPWLQQQFPAWQAEPLAGAYIAPDRPIWMVEDWLGGRFQQQYVDYVSDRSKIKPLLVRQRNQWEFEWFQRSSNPIIEVGKEGYVFDKNYTKAYMGLDLQPDSVIQMRIQKLAVIRDYLGKKGIEVLVLNPPGKATHIPEKLPAHYPRKHERPTNRKRYTHYLEEAGISYLNFEELRAMEDTSGYLHYSRGGLHWSLYGATAAMELTSQRIESLLDIKLPEMQWRDSLSIEAEKGTDREILNAMNLRRIPDQPNLAYPVQRYHNDSTHTRPNVLILGDSFYGIWYEQGFQQAFFAPKSAYWHYFERINPAPSEGDANPRARNLIEEVLQRDLVILSCSETNLPNFGFGFIEALYEGINK